MEKKKGFMVLSLRDLRQLAKTAREDSKRRYAGKVVGKACLVLSLSVDMEADENDLHCAITGVI